LHGISIARGGTFRTDPILIAQLRDILQPSYVDARPLLTRELVHCDTLYLYRDAFGQPESFFLVAWEVLLVGAEQVPTAYLGLSATRQDTKNSAIVRELYAAFLREAAAWERHSGQPLVLWFTTATPSVCLVAYTMFANAEPRAEGSFTERGATIAATIRSRLGLPATEGTHPFVLKGVAGSTRYSAGERERIHLISAKRNFTMLQDLGGYEECGDRLLYVCYVPKYSPEPVASAGPVG